MSGRRVLPAVDTVTTESRDGCEFLGDAAYTSCCKHGAP